MNLDFPFHFDVRGRTAGANPHDHLRDMIELLLFTDSGERVNRPDFGSGLRQLVFAPNSAELAAALQVSVQATLQRWLGDLIELDELVAASENGELRLLIRYRVSDEETLRSLELTRTV